MSYQDHKEREKQLGNVLIALQSLCKREVPHTAIPPQTQWPKTREIAEFCEMTIYLARYYLLRLVENKKAYVTTGALNNILRWYIAETSQMPRQHGSLETTSVEPEKD